MSEDPLSFKGGKEGWFHQQLVLAGTRFIRTTARVARAELRTIFSGKADPREW